MNHNTTFACSVSTKDDEVLKACTNLFSSVCEIIKDKLKDVDTIQKTAQDMKSMSARLEIQIKNAMDKVEEVRGMSDNLRALNSKVERLEYGQDNQDIRRREK